MGPKSHCSLLAYIQFLKSVAWLAMLKLQVPWSDHLTASAQHDLLFSVPCCFLLDRLIKEATCNVMVDHLQSRVTPWRQYASHVKVRRTLSKMDVYKHMKRAVPICLRDKAKIALFFKIIKLLL